LIETRAREFKFSNSPIVLNILKSTSRVTVSHKRDPVKYVFLLPNKVAVPGLRRAENNLYFTKTL
jgi:hypothetical protein